MDFGSPKLIVDKELICEDGKKTINTTFVYSKQLMVKIKSGIGDYWIY